jgi:signal transduction histidine kinase
MAAIAQTEMDAAASGAERAPRPARSRSLKQRLIVISLAWLAFSLLATGAVLILLFRAHMQRHFDQSMLANLEELAAAVQVEAGGAVNLAWEPADPRYRKPLSGWYWEVRGGRGVVRSSPSLMGQSLAVTAASKESQLFDDVPGPGGVRLRGMVEEIRQPDGGALLVAMAGPCVTVRRDVLIFLGQLAAALTVLGITLGALIAAQIAYGLRPLKTVRAALTGMRLGHHSRLRTDGPREIAPLVDELNALLSERDAIVAEARAEAGNLAHALKTPIAVIRNEAAGIAGQAGETLKDEAAKMMRAVEHHLVRARSQAKPRHGPVRAPLGAVMDDIRFSLERLYPGKLLQIGALEGLTAACSEDDLGEMIGNLADNACKWARQRVCISAERDGGRIRICIEDDGAGLTEEQRAEALGRGKRLDERMPGHGLGLSIASQLAHLHGGDLQLDRSELGGLSAVLDLPAADARGARTAANAG